MLVNIKTAARELGARPEAFEDDLAQEVIVTLFFVHRYRSRSHKNRLAMEKLRKVAAVDLSERIGAQEFTLYFHYAEVKRIPEERFQRRKEGRIKETGVPFGTASNCGRTRVVDGLATAHQETPSQPRRVRPAV